MDFFGKGNVSPLDTIIELGKSGFNNLLAKNNVDAYNISLANNNGTKDLFSTIGYRGRVRRKRWRQPEGRQASGCCRGWWKGRRAGGNIRTRYV